MAKKNAASAETGSGAEAQTEERALRVGDRVLYGWSVLEGSSGTRLVGCYADVLETAEDGPTLRIHHPDGSIDVKRYVQESETGELVPFAWCRLR